MTLNIYIEVERMLRDTRIIKGITRHEVAGKLGLTVATLTRYEQGRCRLPLGTMCRLLKFYGMSLSFVDSQDSVFISLKDFNETVDTESGLLQGYTGSGIRHKRVESEAGNKARKRVARKSPPASVEPLDPTVQAASNRLAG